MDSRRSGPHYPDYVTARIARLRKRSGLSQKEVAQFLGVGQQTYSAYERGASMMHIKEFVRLAELYNVSVDFITGASDLMGEYPRF